MGILDKLVKTAFKPVVNNVKGAVGEHKVSSKLNPLFFGKVEHRQINDLIIMDDNGKSHQIDHVEIRKNGIFCIETKNYSGWIFGNENQQMWTQTLYNEKHQFPNPIKQNASHIYHLNKVLGGRYRINSVIVMVQNNADRVNIPYVVNLDNLKSYIDNYDDGTSYSEIEMDEIYNILNLVSKTGVSHRKHIKNIKETQKDIANNICPRCGNKLVLKNGKYGEFYGCSNYPKCQFIKKST